MASRPLVKQNVSGSTFCEKRESCTHARGTSKETPSIRASTSDVLQDRDLYAAQCVLERNKLC